MAIFIKKNSKKGMTLLELILAIVIIVIVMMGTVSAFALSYNSILIGAEKDKMSAQAQTKSDIVASVMNYKKQTDFWDTDQLKSNYIDNLKQDIGTDDNSYVKNISDIGNGTHAKGDIRYNVQIKTGVKPESGSTKTIDVAVATVYIYYTDKDFVKSESTATLTK